MIPQTLSQGIPIQKAIGISDKIQNLSHGNASTKYLQRIIDLFFFSQQRQSNGLKPEENVVI